MIRPEELGKKGEFRFRELCAEAGITCNSSGDDTAGWDFLLNFSTISDGLSLDLRPPPTSCYVQVKTISAPSRTAKLTLNMAERLAKYPVPSFICVMVVNSDRQFQAVYLIHLFDERLAAVLKRLRGEEARGRIGNLNKQTIQFTPDESDEFDLSGISLKQRIEHHIGTNFDGYIAAKKNQRETLGFEERPYAFTVRFEDEDPDVILDALAGRKKDVQVELSEMFVQRFNIPLPFGTPGKAKLTISVPQPEKCTLLYRTQNSAAPLVFNGIVKHVPRVYGISRIYLEFETFVFILEKTADGDNKLHCREEERDMAITLDERINTLRLFDGLSLYQGYIEILFSPSTLPYRLNFNDVLAREGVGRNLRHSEELLKILEELEIIVKFSGVVPPPQFLYKDIVHARQEIQIIKALMDGSVPKLEVVPDPDGQQITVVTGRNILPFTFLIGEILIACYGVMNIDDPTNESQTKLNISDFFFREIRFMPSTKENLERFIDHAKNIEKTDNVVKLPSLLIYDV